LALASETALERIVRELFLTPQKLPAAQVVREVIGRCGAEKLPIPSASTVRRRLAALSLADPARLPRHTRGLSGDPQ
jgi:hypothetical protein